MNYKAAIFDLDGTLINSLADIADAANHVMEQFGFPTHETDTYRFIVGGGVTNLITRSLPEDKRIHDIITSCLQSFKAYYHQHHNIKTKLYDGIPAMLDGLDRRNIRLAILTNKAHELTMDCVSEFLPDWTFDMILGQKQGVPEKPDPSGAFEIVRQMNLLPSQCIYLGDSDVDMQTAVAAGMFPVGVLWGFRTPDELRRNGAKALLKTPEELLDII